MTTATHNYGWLMPDPGGSANTWGDTLNATTTAIDAQVWAANIQVKPTNLSVARGPDGGAYGQINFNNNGNAKARWVLYETSEPEGAQTAGTATGTNFGLEAYDNTGAPIGTVYTISRATQIMSFIQGISVTGTATFNGTATFAEIIGSTTFAGAVTMNSALTVNGVFTAYSTAAVEGMLNAQGGLAVTGAATVSGTVTSTSGSIASNAASATTSSFFLLNDNTAALKGYLQWNYANNHISLVNQTGGSAITLNADGTVSTGVINALNNITLQQQASGNYTYSLINGAGTTVGSFGCLGATTGAVGVFTNLNSGQLYIDVSGNFFYANGTGTAYKTGGGSWTAASDARIKTVVGDYAPGLSAVLQLRPVTYTYRGNDTSCDVDGVAPYSASPHFAPAKEGKRFVGFVAQELEAIFPDMVSETAGFIDGQAVTDLKSVDTSNLVFALVNAVKQLKAEIETLKAGR